MTEWMSSGFSEELCLEIKVEAAKETPDQPPVSTCMGTHASTRTHPQTHSHTYAIVFNGNIQNHPTGRFEILNQPLSAIVFLLCS